MCLIYYNLVSTSYVIVNVVPIMYVMLIEKPRVPKSILHYEYTHAWEIQKLEEEEEQWTQKSMTQVVLFLGVIAFHRG